MNSAETTQFNCTFLVQSVVAAVGAVGGTVMSIVKRVPPRRLAALCMIPVVLLLAAWCIAWGRKRP